MSDADTISLALVSARRTAAILNGFPGNKPDSMAQAYAIQSASIARWPDNVAGWKVGMLSPSDQKKYHAERLAGPIFRSQIHSVANGGHHEMPIYSGGFAAVEAEFVFRLGKTVQANQHQWNDEEILEMVGGLHIGAEIASSPIVRINDHGPTVVASDFGNNSGLLLGAEIPDWETLAPEQLPSRVVVDGEVVGEASAAAIPGGPFAALRFIIELSAKRGLDLPSGTLVSTGASTGIHDVNTNSKSRVDFGPYGWFDVSFVSMPVNQ